MRPRFFGAFALAAVVLFAVGVGSAAAETTLAGEMLVSPFDNFSITSGTCNATGSSTFTFDATGPAVGPATGRFEETGSLTIASPTGPVTAFDATFTITEADGTVVTGTKTLQLGTAVGSCQTFGVFAEPAVTGTTIYSVSSPFTETGTAPLTLDFSTDTFSEGPFTPGAPMPKTKKECKKGGGVDAGFKNQGQCIKDVNH